MKHDQYYTRETIKVAELKDLFGITRFKISLTDFDDPDYPEHDDLRKWDDAYQVLVVSYSATGTSAPLIIVSESHSEYHNALDSYNKYVAEYHILLNAETKGWQDIHNFDELIHYHIIDCDCCKNCIYAKPVTKDNCLFSDWRKHKARFYCTNPRIAKKTSDFDPLKPRIHDSIHGYSDERVSVEFDLAPYVQEDGICDDYKRRLEPVSTYRTKLQSNRHFLEHVCGNSENIVDAEIKYQVKLELENSNVDEINGNTVIEQ